jgi:hypothetical protein
MTVDAIIKYNSSERWAKELMFLNLEFFHNMCLERNKIEHNEDENPENRKKEKLIETILGEFELLDEGIYDKDEMETEKLMLMPVENLQMMEVNIENAKKRQWQKRKKNILPN